MGALRFRLFGIPVAVNPSFWFLTLFLQFSELARPERLAAWVAVVFTGVLIHEMGHALTIRAFGFAPAIELHGLGGLTAWDTQGGMPGPGKRLLISLAGPFAGIAFGFGTIVVALAAGHSSETIWSRTSIVDYVVASIVWVNAGWGILNLLPVYPLDGGQVVASLCDFVVPGRGRIWALRLTIVSGAVVCALGLWLGAPILAIISGLYVFQAVMTLRVERHRESDGHSIARLHAARQALDAGDVAMARGLAEGVRAEGRSAQTTGAALEMLAWAAVAERDFAGAARLLTQLPKGYEADGLLGGIVDFEHGHFEHAAAAFTRELERRPTPEVAARLCETLVRADRAAALRELFGVPGFDGLLAEADLAALVTVARDEGRFEAAALLDEKLAARRGGWPVDAAR
jgi:Zn-dependent protease